MVVDRPGRYMEDASSKRKRYCSHSLTEFVSINHLEIAGRKEMIKHHNSAYPELNCL